MTEDRTAPEDDEEAPLGLDKETPETETPEPEPEPPPTPIGGTPPTRRMVAPPPERTL